MRRRLHRRLLPVPELNYRAFFDAPDGTQVCATAIERMVAHLRSGIANAGGAFATSRAVARLSGEAHEAMADLLDGNSRGLRIPLTDVRLTMPFELPSSTSTRV